jgi:carbon-monoxide dehydrogenase iron sulfur subunit
MAKVFMIHPERCTGCQNCRMACSFSHENQFRPAAARVHVFTSEREGYSVPMMCQQCDAAPCMKVCPTGALYRAQGSTLVEYARAKCMGCRICTMACPFGSAVYDSVTESILKCDTCGGEPACALFCPTQAIEFIEENIATRTRRRAFAAKFKSAFEGTRP